jgi:hypothetical protein
MDHPVPSPSGRAVICTDGTQETWSTYWTCIRRRVDAGGLDWPTERELLSEAWWRLCSDVECKPWPGFEAALNDLGSTEPTEPEAPALSGFLTRLDWVLPAYLDIRSPDRPDALITLKLRERDRQSLRATTQRFLKKRDAATFLPLLLAVRLRYPDDGLQYVDVLEEVMAVLEIPRLLCEMDRRVIRWTATQVFRFWLSPEEAIRHLNGRLVDPHLTSELTRWRVAMQEAT